MQRSQVIPLGDYHVSLICSSKTRRRYKKRIHNLGEIKDRSSHWLMKRAILDYLEREEKAEQEKREDKERWEHYAQTGEAISHDDMKNWLKSL